MRSKSGPKILVGTVIGSDFPNKGIVESPEGRGVVKGTLPGQTVSFSVKRKRNALLEGKLISVLEKSPLESEVKCPHFGICGGCAYQSLVYEDEVRLKDNQIRSLFENVRKNHDRYFPENWFEEIVRSPFYTHYRGKMEYSFGNMYVDGPLTLGMHTPGHYNDVVTVEHCQIADRDFNVILKEVLHFFEEKQASFRRKATGKGLLRNLVLRKGQNTGEILILLVTTSEPFPYRDEFLNRMLSLDLTGKVVGVLHEINDGLADTVNGGPVETLFGRDYYYELIMGLKFRVGVFSFFQTNAKGAELLYGKAASYAMGLLNHKTDLKDSFTLLDLYSGTGTITQIMAKKLGRGEAIGIELDADAVHAAEENARENGITNVSFYAGDVFRVLDSLEFQPDLIMLDPPRDGTSPKALKKILSYAVPGFIYISCKPTSLARDMGTIFESGYRLDRLCAVDMFPGTPNVEVVAAFRMIESTSLIG